MPTITVQLESPIRRTFRVMQVAGMFDVAIEERLRHELTAEVPGLDEPWTIGAIVGPSGSGKTTLAKAAFGAAFYEPQAWPDNAPIVDCLSGAGIPACHKNSADKDVCPTIKVITRVLTAVGLGSVPTWLKPYNTLSTGERFRADLALALLRCEATSLLVIDEFTSSLDRTIAKTTSAALARLIRQDLSNVRFVAVTCHTDILAWLEPDWVLQLDGNGGFRLTRGRLRRPTIRLHVHKVSQAMWGQFARHHYLAGGLARSATCYGAFWDGESSDGGPARAAHACPTLHDCYAAFSNDEVERRVDAAVNQVGAVVNRPANGPIAFCAAVAALGWKKTKRITRLVTLPEFQGLGIASRLLQNVAEHEANKGNRVTITASHPAILAHCQNSPYWRLTGHKPTGSTIQTYRGRRIGCSVGRAVASFEFIAGDAER